MMTAEIWLGAAEVQRDRAADVIRVFNNDLVAPIRKDLALLQLIPNADGVTIQQLDS